MNVGKLKRVAIKEFKRSPGKTGFLLVMIPVALYFCVPLLLGVVKKKSSPSSGAAAVGVAAEKAEFVLPAATNAIVLPSKVELSWVEVARSLANDLLATPAGVPAIARNPFAAKHQEKNDEPIAAVEGDEPEEPFVGPETEAELKASIDQIGETSNPIRALGLELNATVVGQRSRLATINGKSYKEGETIPVIIDSGEAADAVTAVSLELAHVERRFVVLKMDGVEHSLQLRNDDPRDATVVKSRGE